MNEKRCAVVVAGLLLGLAGCAMLVILLLALGLLPVPLSTGFPVP
jgi:hypothetical protein